MQKHHPEKAEELREALQSHLENINNLVNESMVLLYKLPDIARQFQLDLPDWIPKPPALVNNEIQYNTVALKSEINIQYINRVFSGVLTLSIHVFF